MCLKQMPALLHPLLVPQQQQLLHRVTAAVLPHRRLLLLLVRVVPRVVELQREVMVVVHKEVVEQSNSRGAGLLLRLRWIQCWEEGVSRSQRMIWSRCRLGMWRRRDRVRDLQASR